MKTKVEALVLGMEKCPLGKRNTNHQVFYFLSCKHISPIGGSLCQNNLLKLAGNVHKQDLFLDKENS